MELFEEILIQEIKQRLCISFDSSAIIHDVCYLTLQKIKAIIEDDSLDDPECFMKIEEIIKCFEGIGSDGGFRHDFG